MGRGFRRSSPTLDSGGVTGARIVDPRGGLFELECS
jgi:hypothetical protein